MSARPPGLPRGDKYPLEFNQCNGIEDMASAVLMAEDWSRSLCEEFLKWVRTRRL
jgi:hypothetical protein